MQSRPVPSCAHDSTRVPSRPMSRRVYEALRIVTARFNEPSFRVAEVAMVLRLSSSHLTRIIKDETGFTIREHVAQLRMAAAKAYLRETFLSVKEIAVAVGYSSTSSFDHEFAHRFGSSPRTWRQKVRIPPPLDDAVS